MRSTIWVVAAALLLATSPAFAGGGARGDFEIGAYGGYGWLDDYGSFHPKDNGLFGGRIGYFITPNWSVEGSGQHLGTKSEFEPPAPPDVDVHIDSWRGNLLYNLKPGEKFRPFVTAGLGSETFDAESYSKSSDMGWNAGVGFRWFFNPMFNLRVDGRYVGVKVDKLDETEGNVEATAGLGFTFGPHGAEAKEKVSAAPPPPPNQAPTVTCSAERNEIQPGETVTVRATATDPEGDPLTYAWSTTSGKVTGETSAATLDFAGVTAPSSATVTVKVSDNHGNTSSCDYAVSLMEPKKAEAVSCLAGGFPNNLSRLTNVDKACLDDVAQRLKNDPRATVTVIGYADRHEKSAQTLSDARAKAVRDYLTKEQSIETSRITVKASGSTKPVDAGSDVSAQARNRRVEVWFVPEGATIPEQ
jgi:OOP family OmpA-OmpF porin